MRQLLRRNGMPQPDKVEYGHGCIRLLFDDPQVVLVVDIDEPGDGYGAGSLAPEPGSFDAELN